MLAIIRYLSGKKTIKRRVFNKREQSVVSTLVKIVIPPTAPFFSSFLYGYGITNYLNKAVTEPPAWYLYVLPNNLMLNLQSQLRAICP